MDVLLLDLDGVIYEGDRAVPGAQRALNWLEHTGIRHLFVTNTTSRPRSALVAKLARLGIDVAPENILTPAVAASTWLAARGARTLRLLVPEATAAEFHDFERVASDEGGRVDAVVVGDLGQRWDFATLNGAFRLLMREPSPRLVALGMTRYWRAADGLRLDTAPFVVALAHASGVEPVVLGKPAAPFFEAALARLGAAPADALMVGDDIRADVRGAQDNGIRGVLVRTGKYRAADESCGIEPFAIIDSVAELPSFLEGLGVAGAS